MISKKELSAFFKFPGTESTTEPKKDTIGNIKDYGDDWLRMRELNNLGQGSTISNPYSQSAWVYRAVSVIATNVPQAPFTLYKGIDKLPPTDPTVQLFNNPNTLQSAFEFWESIAGFLNLYGEAFIFMNESIGQQLGTRSLPAELVPLNPKLVRHCIEDNQLISWEYNGMPIEIQDLIHLSFFNPNFNTIRGQSPIQAAKFEIEADYSASKFNKTFFDNNATPDGVVSVDKDKQIDIKELRKLKKMWYQNHQGVDNAHKTAFLLGGMTYSHMGISQKDMEWIEGRKFSRDAIYSVFGVSPFVAGHYDSGTVTRATAKEATRLFWTNTLIPQLLRIEQKLQSKFFMRFFNDGTWGKFDLSGIEELKEDYGIAVETGNKLFMIGYTRNEVNQRLQLGMPKDDVDGDIRYLPINLVPVGEDEGGVPKKSINLDDKTLNTDKFVETTKNKYQNRYLHIQGAMEKKLESKLKRYFFNLRKKILGIVNGEEKAFTAEEEAEIMAQINALFSGDEIKVVVEPIYRESLKQAGELALENIGIANRTFVISEAILNQRLNLIKGVDNTLFKLIRSEVFDGIKEGENIPNISERIRSVFNTTSNRSKVIARTETASLMSAQTQDVYVKEGIQQKQWLATIDDATRDSHIQTNGEIVPIDQPFSNGLMFPGDPDAPAEEVINCRCSLVPIVQ